MRSQSMPSVYIKNFSTLAIRAVFIACLGVISAFRVPLAVGQEPAVEWTSRPDMGNREVRMPSIATTGSVTAYEMRLGLMRWNSEVNCSAHLYRDSPVFSGRPEGHWVPIADFGDTTKAEFEFICGVIAEQSGSLPKQSRKSQQEVDIAIGRIKSTGSGFLVDAMTVVTNRHVVQGCRTVAIVSHGRTVAAYVRALSTRDDLALIATSERLGRSIAVRSRAIQGEDVTVAGFPLAGLLTTDLIVTGGTVSATAGPFNDPGLLQVSAAVQPGNSGGPLLDKSGALVGVIVSKLDAGKLATLTGDIAQNVNFAIKPEIVRLFLETNRVPYRDAKPGARVDGTQLADKARSFTVQVLCGE
jgi:S1-C subfamily serine protease